MWSGARGARGGRARLSDLLSHRHWAARAVIRLRLGAGYDVTILRAARSPPSIGDEAAGDQHGAAVGPEGGDVTFIQLDNIRADKLPAFAPAVFSSLKLRWPVIRHGLLLGAPKTEILVGV